MAESPASVLNYKPIFMKFFEANDALLDCMAAIPKSSIADMSAAQLDSSCQREKIEIKRILDSNQMTMTQLVKDRVNILRTINEIGITYEERTVQL